MYVYGFVMEWNGDMQNGFGVVIGLGISYKVGS